MSNKADCQDCEGENAKHNEVVCCRAAMDCRSKDVEGAVVEGRLRPVSKKVSKKKKGVEGTKSTAQQQQRGD